MTVLTARDGRSARAWRSRGGEVLVSTSGLPDLWTDVERAHRLWVALGRPDWERFGLLVTPDEQVVWLDSPERPLPALPRL